MLESIKNVFKKPSRTTVIAAAEAALITARKAEAEAREVFAAQPDYEGTWEAVEAAERERRKAEVLVAEARRPVDPTLARREQRLAEIEALVSMHGFETMIVVELRDLVAAEQAVADVRRRILEKLQKHRSIVQEGNELARSLGAAPLTPLGQGNAIGISQRYLARAKAERNDFDDASQFIRPAFGERE